MDQKLLGLSLIIVIGAALAGIAKLIQRGKANPGVVLILILLPVLFLFGVSVQDRGIPQGLGDLSGSLIIGVIASLIAGIILLGIKKK